MPPFPARDVQVVRNLARQIVELSTSDEYEARRQRWRDANERRKGNRAPVWCRPAAAWSEILPQSELECEDPTCRNVEVTFRQHLYKHWVEDDHIFEPWWSIGAAWDCDSEHTWGVRIPAQVAGTDLGGFRYDPPVKEPEDYDNITVPTFTYNHERSEQAVARMQDLFGDAMEVRLTCAPPLGPQLGTFLDKLRGMAPMLEDLAFRPERLHRCLAKLTEGVLRACRAAEDTGLLTTNHHQPMYCSDPVNGEAEAGQVRLHNLWADANSQEFQEVSPAMQEEFLLNYQIPIFQQFGATQYGCCEDLTQKIDIILRIPNLRTFVCSAWTDLGKVIEACNGRYTIMWRQPAAEVMIPDDTSRIREHLREGMSKLRDHPYQVVLREVQSLHGHPGRIREWTRLAIEAAEEFAG